MNLSLTPPLGALVSQRIGVIAVAVLICAVIFELIRRKHLMERYAILWFCLGVTTLVLAAWKGLLTTLSHAAGIYYPPAALFAVAFLFVLALLLHFSLVLSRLSDQNKILAQRLALLQQRIDEKESAEGEENKEQPAVHESSQAS
ncbi:MAG TPA: DUF2304 domain-containing protein, partial [Solirubrobacterales bacterium]|nr:DUF2304 domain-containing protein [Solirubrobacterales bacterium]